jgi:hypothetical protein
MTNKPSKMTDQEIDTALAEMMGWEMVQMTPTSKEYWGVCHFEPMIGLVGHEVIEIANWHPHDDLNQVWQCEEQIINNYNRTRSRPGRICDWYTVKLQEMLIPRATHSDIICGNDHELLIVHATARQKCEAMLMAMEENE